MPAPAYNPQYQIWRTQCPLFPPLFSRSRKGPIEMPFSTALYISYNVRADTGTAVVASISTPVSAFVLAVASIRAPESSTSIEMSRWVSGRGFQGGINSEVFLGAWIRAILATSNASPFGIARSRRQLPG